MIDAGCWGPAGFVVGRAGCARLNVLHAVHSAVLVDESIQLVCVLAGWVFCVRLLWVCCVEAEVAHRAMRSYANEAAHLCVVFGPSLGHLVSRTFDDKVSSSVGQGSGAESDADMERSTSVPVTRAGWSGQISG